MYGKWLYKEIGTEYGACMVEIYRKNYTGESIEIGALAADSLSIALENLGSITDPIGKSVCSFSIIDTNQVEYDDFFTPDATALKVVVSTRVGNGAYVTRWSGYVTPDFFAENLSYRTPISISARDNIGYLNDVDFDLTATTITVRELIQSAFTRIAGDYPMSLSFVTQKQTAEGILAIDAIISTTLLREMSWGEALETILHDLGLQMRWVDNNTIAVLDLSQIPEYYATQGFNFIGASGYREIVPAWRQLGQEQDYGFRENFFDGWLRTDNMTFVKEEVVTDDIGREYRIKLYAPNNWQVSGNTYTINLANYRSISRIDGFTLQTLAGTYREIPFKGFENRIFFTGTRKENTDYSSYMGYRMPIYSGQSPLEITFKALNTYLIPEDDTLHIYNPIDDIIFADSSIPRVQLGIKMNILLHSGVNTYILKEKWEQLTSAETDSITFVLDKIGGVEPYYHTTDYDKEQELSINIHSIPFDGELELRIYGYFIESAEDAVSSDYEEFASRYVTYINDVTYAYVNKDITGQSALVGVNDTHNIKQAESYKIGQVVDNRGNINAFAGGLYYPANTPNPLYPMRGFQRNADATNYNLLELVGREIIHFNKRNYNRLSGTIRNLDKEPLMFNRLFVREGKKYAPYNYSLNVISNEMNITSMQEVEPYTTASFTEINSEISTGGSTVSSGNNQVLQYSAEVGNAKRLYELQTISENEKPDAYVLVDGAGYPEARKLKLTDIAGLDEKALEQYLVQYKYLQEADITPIIQDFEKLDEAVSPLFGYFDATGNANNALKLGGQLPSYYAPQSSLDTTNANVTSLTQKLSTIESGVATNKTNIATLTTNLSDLTGRVDVAEDALKTYGDSIAKNATEIAANATAIGNNETAILQLGERVDKLEGYWYIDNDGNLHTTYSIVVDKGGAFGKGSGGGGDVPSGGGIDETQLWNILGQSGTQTIHGSHIPDLSGKYLSVSGGTINGNLSIKRGGYPYISYSNADTFYGYLGFSGVGVPSMYDGTAWRDVIHSGNIGSYNAGSATKLQTARTIWGQNFDGAGNITKTLHITEPVPNTEYAEGIRINTMNGDFSSIWFNTINISGYDKGMWGITAMASGNFRIRGGANGLSDLVNITKDGNVLMGTTNDGGHKLRVQGSSYVTGEGIFGGVISANSGILSRNELSFRNNAVIQSYSLPLQINPQGNNVLIGTNADNGYKLAVNGSLNATTIHQNGTAIGSLAFKNSLVASDIPSLDWSKITSGKPTTLGGYGITDFVVKTTSSLNNATATAGIYRLGGTAPDNHGYGNAITLRHLSADTYGQLYISYNMGIPQGGVYWRGATTDSTAQSWRWMLDESNYSSYALPLSGGTIDGALKVNGNLSTDNVRFNREGVTQILAAYAGLNYDLSYYDGATWERVLTSKNYSSYALPLSGGTISSSGLAPLNIKRNSTGAAAIAYSGQSVTYGTLGFNDTTGPKWFDASYAEYTLIHSGNIGSQRVANADTLDDYDSTAFMRFNREEGTDLNSLSTNFPRIVEVVSATNTPTSNLWHQVMNWGSADAGYGIQVAHKYTDAATPLYFRNKVAGEWSDWKQLARITDNVASATKLQDNTAFTAWGQIFFNNGKPVSLSGKLTSVSYLRFYDANATSPGIYGGTHYSSSLTANDLAIYASGKIAIGGGNVLIGTTDDNGRKLQVNGKMSAHDYEGGSFSSNHADSFVENDKPIPWYGLSVYEGYTKGVFLTGYSFIHIHTTYCRFTLNSLGANLNHNLTVSGGGAFGSDIRYKDITSYQQLDLETIVNAPLFTFKWTDRDDKVEHLGTSAQYWLETQAKDAVNTANKDFYHLDYGALGVGIGISVAREVKGVKTEVQTLKEELSQVKKELKYYKELWQHSGHILHQHS